MIIAGRRSFGNFNPVIEVNFYAWWHFFFLEFIFFVYVLQKVIQEVHAELEAVGSDASSHSEEDDEKWAER